MRSSGEAAARCAPARSCAASPTRSAPTGDVLRVAVWRLDSGDPGDPALLTAAATGPAPSATWTWPNGCAGPPSTPAATCPSCGVTWAVSCWFADRYEEAETAFREGAWDTGVGDFDTTACAVNRAMNLTWGLGRLDDALAVLAEADGRVTSLSERHALMIVGATLHAECGDLPAARELLARAGRLGPVDQRARRAEAVAIAGVLAASGRATETLTVVEDARRLFGLVQDPLPGLLASLLGAATSPASRPATCSPSTGYRRSARQRDRVRPLDPTAVQFTAFQGLGLRLRGQVQDALTRAAEAAVRLPSTSVYAGVCLGSWHTRMLSLGDVDAAEETLRRP